MVLVKDIIKKELSAIKRGELEIEGGIKKHCTNTKEEQKLIIGHSPDFADNFMMREDFKFGRIRKGKFKSSG